MSNAYPVTPEFGNNPESIAFTEKFRSAFELLLTPTPSPDKIVGSPLINEFSGALHDTPLTDEILALMLKNGSSQYLPDSTTTTLDKWAEEAKRTIIKEKTRSIIIRRTCDELKKMTESKQVIIKLRSDAPNNTCTRYTVFGPRELRNSEELHVKTLEGKPLLTLAPQLGEIQAYCVFSNQPGTFMDATRIIAFRTNSEGQVEQLVDFELTDFAAQS